MRASGRRVRRHVVAGYLAFMSSNNNGMIDVRNPGTSGANTRTCAGAGADAVRWPAAAAGEPPPASEAPIEAAGCPPFGGGHSQREWYRPLPATASSTSLEQHELR